MIDINVQNSVYDLSRFIQAQQCNYKTALAEIKSEQKRTHWMWYIFPQLKGLGKSATSEYYGIQNLDEAKAFLQDKTLGVHLLEISNALLCLDCDDARILMGSPDNIKLKSCMTLFSVAAPQEQVFKAVLEKFFHGKPDYRTLRLLDVAKESVSMNETGRVRH